MAFTEARASAKIILFGEHAVVYGQPALAAPLSALQAHATMQVHDGPFVIFANDLSRPRITLGHKHPLMRMARSVFNALSIEPPRARLDLTSQIPIASGLGSGAAVSTVIGRVIAKYVAQDLNVAQLNDLVYQIEQTHHGTPSGIDNTVIVYEQAVFYVRNKPIQTIHNAAPLILLVADTGRSARTKIAVGDVAKLMRTKPQSTQQTVDQIGQVVVSARTAMEAGDHQQLGQLMLTNHRLLQALTVSSSELDQLVEAAIGAGALGAKLSGGGRGGNMIALVDTPHAEQVANALYKAGAVNVIETTISGETV